MQSMPDFSLPYLISEFELLNIAMDLGDRGQMQEIQDLNNLWWVKGCFTQPGIFLA